MIQITIMSFYYRDDEGNATIETNIKSNGEAKEEDIMRATMATASAIHRGLMKKRYGENYKDEEIKEKVYQKLE
jgi:hypothetical protein